MSFVVRFYFLSHLHQQLPELILPLSAANAPIAVPMVAALDELRVPGGDELIPKPGIGKLGNKQLMHDTLLHFLPVGAEHGLFAHPLGGDGRTDGGDAPAILRIGILGRLEGVFNGRVRRPLEFDFALVKIGKETVFSPELIYDLNDVFLHINSISSGGRTVNRPYYK